MKKSTKPINRISMAIAMLFVSLAIHAQRFVNTSLEGAQTVCAITQDSDGMIWLGTDNGLYSYDGYHGYRHFQEHTFSNTRVNALGFEGRMLYLATGNGILKFDTQSYQYAETPLLCSLFRSPSMRSVSLTPHWKVLRQFVPLPRTVME
jgi:hypothetical protein